MPGIPLIKIALSIILITSLLSCKEDGYVNAKSEAYLSTDKIFVGSEACASCHTKEFEEWQNSHHDLAMQEANSTTVLGDFNNADYISKGIRFKFFKKNGSFYVNTEGIGGTYDDYRITHTFGVYPLQQYLIEFPDGKYQCLLAAWDAEKGVWYDLQPDLEIHHSEWLHWTGGSMTWNKMCADCHSTNLKKNYDPIKDVYKTTYDIVNVSCEACHGPGSEHETYYNNLELNAKKNPPKLYMEKNMASKEVVQKCARCHSRRTQLTNHFDYEGDFLDHYAPFLIAPPAYELDGQINDEVYVYGSFVQSNMFQEGVSCNDCHNPHSLGLKMKGNTLCLSCHTPDYDDYSHHFHQQAQGGTQCVDCHMTGRTYMGNDFRRDHSFRVPRPDQTVLYGTPNACTNCHQDKSAQWATDAIVKNYGDERPKHFSDDLLAGYHGDLDAFYKVFSNLEYPEIVRATALNRYGNNALSEEDLSRIQSYLNDLSPLVRKEAIIALSTDYKEYIATKIEPLLLDSVRMVRISAASYFKNFNEGVFMEDKNKQAESDYNKELSVNADFASGQHRIALDYQARGYIDKAIEAYNKALEIDNYYNMSRVNMALLEYNRGNVNIAEQHYLKVTEQEPEFSHSFLMLGLLYNESGKTEKALEYLKLACEKEPKLFRSFYNYALKLQENNLNKESLDVLDEGLELYPNNENLLYVKLIGLLKLNRNQEAYALVQKLLLMSPNNSNYLSILRNLESRKKP